MQGVLHNTFCLLNGSMVLADVTCQAQCRILRDTAHESGGRAFARPSTETSSSSKAVAGLLYLSKRGVNTSRESPFNLACSHKNWPTLGFRGLF